MRILVLTSHVDIGGITSYLLILTSGLQQRGHQVWVMSGGGALEVAFHAQGVAHIRMPLRAKSELHPKLWLAYRRIRRFLDDHQVDVIHAQTRVAQVVGTWLSRRTGIPMVSTWHGYLTPRWGRRLCPCMGERVIAISPPVQQHLVNAFRVPPARVALIEHGIPLERFQAPSPEARRTLRQEFGIAADDFAVGVVARLNANKGVDRLIRAIAHVATVHPRVRLVIVGSGPEEARLRALAASLHLTNRVLWLGSQADLTAPLGMLDCFGFPVLQREGFGLVVLEAMAMELPVIATTQPALRLVLDDGRAGWLVPPDDVLALVRAITEVIEEPARAKQVALRGLARVRDAFGAERMIEQTEAVYRSVLQEHHGTAAARRA